MTTPARSPASLLLAIGLVVLGVLGLGQLPAPPQRFPAAVSTPVVGVTDVCPDLSQDPGRLQTRISVGVAPLPDVAGTAGGTVTTQPLRAEQPPVRVPIEHPGQVAVDLGAGVNGDALVVRAAGPLASGLEVEQVTRGETGPNRGLAGLRCEPAATDSWFVGGSTLVGDTTLLVMANPDDTPALVDVRVFTGDGPVDDRPGRGIVVGPRARTLLSLDTLAPDHNLLAVHVSVQRGRVAAALRHTRWDGRVPRGVEWVPQALPPAGTVEVPGIPAGPGRRTVLVTNPSEQDADVSIELTTADAQFIPVGLESVHVPARTTVAREITDQVANTAAAVRVVSSGPAVLAAAFVYDIQEGSVREVSYAGSARPLAGVAVITDVVINQPTESTLILTAPAGGATVEVTPVAIVGVAAAVPPPKLVTVPAGRTTTFRLSTFLPPGATGRLAVQLRPVPGSGPIFATRYLREHGTHGPLTTILELQGTAQRVSRPPVQADPLAAFSVR